MRHIAVDIKIAHSVFALPFALLAACMAETGSTGTIDWGDFAPALIFVILAMIFARTAAMLSNRLLDHRIDAGNPRTAGRAIPSGRLPVRHATMALAACVGLFLLTCLGFLWANDNVWPIILAVPVLAWICLYPLAKRFTWLCHAWLGLSLALSPLAAAIAVSPDALLQQPSIWLLAGMVLVWVTGFDVLYALQDIDIDTSQGLHSMPSSLGAATALWLSRLLHLAAVALLFMIYIDDERMHMLFLVAVLAAAALLIWEHVLIARYGTGRITLAFFTLNGIVSCLLGLFGIIDVFSG